MTYFGNGKGASPRITRDKFQAYVRSHERALLKAFRLFDKDNDGGCFRCARLHLRQSEMTAPEGTSLLEKQPTLAGFFFHLSHSMYQVL